MDFESFFRAYIECALWTATDNEGHSLDSEYSSDSFTSRALAVMRRDCRDFYRRYRLQWTADITDDQAGHDYWLTRNHHGSGFWDRGIANGDALAIAAHAYGSCSVYASRNRLHIT